MATDNSIKQAVGAVNRVNADIKTFTAAITADGKAINGKCSTTGLETGTVDSTVNTEIGKINAAVTAINSRIDVLFPASQANPTPLFIVSGVVEDAAATKIVLTLSEEGAITDETGFTISGCTSAASFSAAAIQTDKTVLHLTTNAAVDDDDVPVIAYNGATGNLVSYADSDDECITEAALAITNNVEA